MPADAGGSTNVIRPARTSHAWMLISLFLVAMSVRVAMVYAYEPVLFSDSTGFMGPTFVPLSYRELAVAILNWDLSTNLGARAPGYPAFMAACFSLFGLDNFHAIVVAQSLLGVILFFAAYWLWSQIYGPGVAAVVATATAVLEPMLILYESSILSESLTIVLLVLALPFLMYAARRASLWSSAVAGLCVAWLGLTRPAFGLLIPLLALYLVLRLGRQFRTRAGIAAVILFLLTAGLPVIGWNAFNYHRFGYFTPMTTWGYILTSHSAPLIAGQPQRYGEYADLAEVVDRYHRQIDWGMGIWLAYPEIMSQRQVSFAEASRLVETLSMKVFRDQPFGYFKSVYQAFGRFWGADMTAGKYLMGSTAFSVLYRIYAYVHAAGCLLFWCVIAVDVVRPKRWLNAPILERLLIFLVVMFVCVSSTVPIGTENVRYKIPLLPLIWGIVAGSLITNLPRFRVLLATWR